MGGRRRAATHKRRRRCFAAILFAMALVAAVCKTMTDSSTRTAGKTRTCGSRLARVAEMVTHDRLWLRRLLCRRAAIELRPTVHGTEHIEACSNHKSMPCSGYDKCAAICAG